MLFKIAHETSDSEMTNMRRVDDELRKRQVIHLLASTVSHNQVAREENYGWYHVSVDENGDEY